MGVGSVSGSPNTSDFKKADQTAQAQAQRKLDQTKLDAILAKQNEASAGASAVQNAQLYQQLQAQTTNQSGDAPNALNSLSAADQSKARDIAAQVMKQILAGPPTAGDAASTGDSSSGGGFGMNSMSANMGANPAAEAADEKIRDAAKVAVYRDIVDQVNSMNNKRLARDAIRQAESSIDAVLSRAKPGDTVRVPSYEFDEKSGEVKSTGVKQMSYEDAQEMRGKLQTHADSISEMSELDTLNLQQMMDKKSQLETMISNVMKSAGDTANGIGANLKA